MSEKTSATPAGESHQNQIVELSQNIGRVTAQKIGDINRITRETKILAVSALIEASRAGQAGKGFGIVADEVRRVSERITEIANELSSELKNSAEFGEKIAAHLENLRGNRLKDLARSMIDIIDRNLYERSCDVRWWATDVAVTGVLEDPTDETRQRAAGRLRVILGSYTVYLDLWIANLQGKIVAHGRSAEYPRVQGADVARESWFSNALLTQTGSEFVATNIVANRLLDDKQVAVYSTCVRKDGKENGQPLGVLGIFFDWEPQAAAVVRSVPLEENEKATVECLLVDADKRVLASSKPREVLKEKIKLDTENKASGHYVDEAGKQVVGYCLTPGYETYKGLGWYGVLIQKK